MVFVGVSHAGGAFAVDKSAGQVEQLRQSLQELMEIHGLNLIVNEIIDRETLPVEGDALTLIHVNFQNPDLFRVFETKLAVHPISRSVENLAIERNCKYLTLSVLMQNGVNLIDILKNTKNGNIGLYRINQDDCG